MKLTSEQIDRYSRQILLKQVGGKGQARLLASRVCVVGAGGLGSPIIQYLVAAGVGTIDVIDSDVVEVSNLQRQVIHNGAGVGMNKAESAAAWAAAINPDVRVVPHAVRLGADNARELFAGADVVLDGSDNFPTRFLVNDACHLLGKPLITGAILQFDGQVTLFPNDGGPDSPCYRCLFPEMPPVGAIPTCREAGVLGAVAGIIGGIQAAECLKLLLGAGDTLAGRLLVFDGLSMRFREIRLHRDKGCALNGDAPSIHDLVSYEQPSCEL